MTGLDIHAEALGEKQQNKSSRRSDSWFSSLVLPMIVQPLERLIFCVPG